MGFFQMKIHLAAKFRHDNPREFPEVPPKNSKFQYRRSNATINRQYGANPTPYTIQ